MKFTDTAGQEQLIEMTTDAGAGLNPGDTVRIIYQPETPREMDLEQPLHTSGTFILALAGLGIIGANIHQSRRLPTSAPASE